MLQTTLTNLTRELERWESTLTLAQRDNSAFSRGMLHGEINILRHMPDEQIGLSLIPALLHLFVTIQEGI